MVSVINLALPVFAIIAAGLAAGRFDLMNGTEAQALNKFVFRFAMPAALFGLTATTTPPGAGDLYIALAYGLAASVAIFGGYFVSQFVFNLKKEEAGAHGFASTLGNAVFLGLPIALTIEGWGRPFVILMLVEGTIFIAIGASLMTAQKESVSLGKRLLKFVVDPLRNPLVAAALVGILFSAAGFTLSGPIKSFFDIFGRAAGPTALFALGLFLATNRLPDIGAIAGRVGAIVIVKLALLPALAISLALLFGVSDPAYLGALALFVCVPSGVVTFIMASQAGVYEAESAAAVTVTTALSVLTISAVLVFFT